MVGRCVYGESGEVFRCSQEKLDQLKGMSGYKKPIKDALVSGGLRDKYE